MGKATFSAESKAASSQYHSSGASTLPADGRALIFWSDLSTIGIKACVRLSSSVADVTKFLPQNGLILEFR